jgi:hypothetical protein
VRNAALSASAVVGLSVVLLPWYALDAYEPNGWDATAWAPAAAAAAIVTIALLRFGLYRTATLTAVVAVGCVAYRVVAPPDFGFGFDGLTVPVERRIGCWVALVSSSLALLATLRLAWPWSAAASP